MPESSCSQNKGCFRRHTRAEAKAAEIMKSKNVTKAQAIDEVLLNDPALRAECEKEG